MSIHEQLCAPFPAEDVQWRIGRKTKDGKKAQVLAYIDARAVMDRLDEVMEPFNWRDSYRPGAQGGVICTLSLRGEDGWVEKEDGAENSDIEAVKGGISDAFKRAAVKWGIGRYIYQLASPWVPIDDYGNFTPPKLPAWALPKDAKNDTPRVEQQEPPANDEAPPADAPKPALLTDYPWYPDFATGMKALKIESWKSVVQFLRDLPEPKGFNIPMTYEALGMAANDWMKDEGKDVMALLREVVLDIDKRQPKVTE